MGVITLSSIVAEVVLKCSTSDEKTLDLQTVESSVQRISLDVLNNYPWSFLEAKDPATELTVVGTTEYTLDGPDGDARFIIDLKYDNRHLDYQERHQFFVDNNSAVISPVRKWTVIGRSSTGSPIVKFRGSITQSDLVIEYLYTKKVSPDVAFDSLPAELAGYLVAKACAEYYPFPQKMAMFEKQSERALAAALAAHTLKPNAVDTDVLDEATKRRVQELNAMVSNDRFGCGPIYNE